MDSVAIETAGFAVRQQILSLQDANAADVTQEVLRAVARASKRLDYDPGRGSFRAWLLTVVRSKLCDFRTSAQRKLQGSGTAETQALLDALPAREQEEALWELENERRLFAWAADKVHCEFEEPSWQAFWRTAVEGQSGQEVADTLGISVGAVYIAKSRILSKIKQRIQQLQGE